MKEQAILNWMTFFLYIIDHVRTDRAGTILFALQNKFDSILLTNILCDAKYFAAYYFYYILLILDKHVGIQFYSMGCKMIPIDNSCIFF